MDADTTARHDADLELLSVDDLRALLRVGRSTAYAVANGDLPVGGRTLHPVRVGRALRVPAREVREAMRQVEQ